MATHRSKLQPTIIQFKHSSYNLHVRLVHIQILKSWMKARVSLETTIQSHHL